MIVSSLPTASISKHVKSSQVEQSQVDRGREVELTCSTPVFEAKYFDLHLNCHKRPKVTGH